MGETSMTQTALAPGSIRLIQVMRLINVVALIGLLMVLAGSLFLQFGVGEQPCPLCLVQRSGMIGLAVGPIMNLMWGLKPQHYAISILAALVGSAGSVRQILLHIQPGDPGYGPPVLGLHLYTWALITFVIAIAGISVLLLFPGQFHAGDEGILRTPLGTPSWILSIGLGVVIWVVIDAFIIAAAVPFECGLGACPDDPPDIDGAGLVGGALYVGGIGIIAIAAGFLLVRWLKKRNRIGAFEQ
jgi:disulfide bond formation protein DsbB